MRTGDTATTVERSTDGGLTLASRRDLDETDPLTSGTEVGTVLHCYVHESFVSRIRDWIETGDALADAARRAGFRPGCIVVEEHGVHDGVPDGLKALIRAALKAPGAIAIAVPHLGHFMVHGDAYGWRSFVERVTGRALTILREDHR